MMQHQEPARAAPDRRFVLRAAMAGLAVPVLGAQAQGVAVPDGPAGRPMPELEDALPRPEGERIGFALVGIGKLTVNQLLPAFAKSKSCKVAALVSGDSGKARRFGGLHGVGDDHLYTYDSFDRIAQDDTVQVVYVVTPNALHEAFVLRAAKAGKHVLCEKPMAPTAAACERMIKACKEAERRLMIAYRCHYEPYNLKAIELCRGGELGELTLLTSDHGRQLDPDDPADQWRMRRELSGGGALVDIGIYALNAMRYLTGEEPVEVSAMLHSNPDDPRFKEVEETCLFRLRFPSGKAASCTTSYGHAGVKRIQVMGSKATLELDPETDYDRHRMWVRTEKEERQIELQEKDQFAAEMDHMAACVTQGKEPRTAGEEGLRDVRIMAAIYESARRGEPVKLA